MRIAAPVAQIAIAKTETGACPSNTVSSRISRYKAPDVLRPFEVSSLAGNAMPLERGAILGIAYVGRTSSVALKSMHLSERMPATRVETHVRVRHILEQWDPVKGDGIPCHSSIPLFAFRAGRKEEEKKEEKGKNFHSALLSRMRVPLATTTRASTRSRGSRSIQRENPASVLRVRLRVRRKI